MSNDTDHCAAMLRVSAECLSPLPRCTANCTGLAVNEIKRSARWEIGQLSFRDNVDQQQQQQQFTITWLVVQKEYKNNKFIERTVWWSHLSCLVLISLYSQCPQFCFFLTSRLHFVFVFLFVLCNCAEQPEIKWTLLCAMRRTDLHFLICSG